MVRPDMSQNSAAIVRLFSGAARREPDISAAAELSFSRHEVSLPRGLELSWLGTAAFRLRYEGFELLIDPYVTRAPLRRALASRRALLSDPDLVARYVPRADAVIVGHTHFDHAVDVPKIAERSGCTVYGSRSLRRLMQLYGLAHRAVVADVFRPYEIGPFVVTFVPSVHSRLLLGAKIPFDGEITCEHAGHLTGSAYRCGQVYGIHIEVQGTTFYHQGSADLLDDCVRRRGVDFLLTCISGRGFSPRFVERTLRRLEPHTVVPMHYDNFFLPLEDELQFLRGVNLAGFVDDVERVSRSFAVRTLELSQAVGR